MQYLCPVSPYIPALLPARQKSLSRSSQKVPAFYPESGSVSNAFEITASEIIQFLLSNFEKVDQVKEFLQNNNLQLVNIPFDKNMPLSPLHFIVADKEQSIVIEPCKDGLKWHDNPFGVLTNNPPFEWHMQNINLYQNLVQQQKYDIKWLNYNLVPFGQGFGSFGLPGDVTPSSRFVRTVFYKFTSICGDAIEDLITQFFHILDAVAMVEGSVQVQNGKQDITIYSSCSHDTRDSTSEAGN